MVVVALTAWKVNQTSYVVDAVAPPQVAAGDELVANCRVEEVLMQLFPETKVTAPEQLSFAGCAKEIVVVKNPNKTRSVVDRGYRKCFISSKGALVFQNDGLQTK